MARKCTAEDVLKDLSPTPEYPEFVAFYVCEIKKGKRPFVLCAWNYFLMVVTGKKVLLEYENGFRVRNCTATGIMIPEVQKGCYFVFYTDESFSIAHQSDPVILMRTSSCVVFCLASNHTLRTCYEWSCGEDRTGGSSPVSHVTKPGVYRCLVTDTNGQTILSHKFDIISKGI